MLCCSPAATSPSSTTSLGDGWWMIRKTICKPRRTRLARSTNFQKPPLPSSYFSRHDTNWNRPRHSSATRRWAGLMNSKPSSSEPRTIPARTGPTLKTAYFAGRNPDAPNYKNELWKLQKITMGYSCQSQRKPRHSPTPPNSSGRWMWRQ